MNIKEFIETNGGFYSDIICKDDNGNEGELLWADTEEMYLDMKLRNEEGVVTFYYGDIVPLEDVEVFEVLSEFENINGWDKGCFPETYDRRVKIKLCFYAHDKCKHDKDMEYIYTGEGYVYFRSAEGEAKYNAWREGVEGVFNE